MDMLRGGGAVLDPCMLFGALRRHAGFAAETQQDSQELLTRTVELLDGIARRVAGANGADEVSHRPAMRCRVASLICN